MKKKNFITKDKISDGPSKAKDKNDVSLKEKTIP